jgi:hypothetical protein
MSVGQPPSLPARPYFVKASWKETMSKTITLPSGNTAVLRDPSTLRYKDRKKVIDAASGKEGASAIMAMSEAIVAILIESWSFDLIIPSVSINSLGELTNADMDALATEALAVQDVIFPSLSSTPETESNPDSPFANSNA